MDPPQTDLADILANYEPHRPKSIARPRVLRRLLQAATYQVVLIVAPAGFGKTTAVNQLLTHCSNPVFVSTPKGTDSIGQFVRVFSQGCAQLIPSMSSPPQQLFGEATQEQEFEIYSSWALEHLRGKSYTIAIDDLQNADSDKQIADFIVRLVDRCGPQLQWIFASRTSGFLPRTQWQAYGISDAAIVAKDLRLTLSEACDLAGHLGSPVTSEQLSNWVDQTNGYPIPLTYAIRASARRGSAEGLTDGMRSLTFDFLAEQLWHSLSPADRSLLELAALLPPVQVRDYERLGLVLAARIITKLCDDIAFLTLSASGAFVVHDLFRDFIRHQISFRGIEAYRSVAQEAVQLLLETERYTDAFSLLVEVDDADGIAAAIERCSVPLDNLEITPKLIKATDRRALQDFGLATLVMHINYWRHTSPKNALRCADELFSRVDATSSQLLAACQAVSSFMHFQPIEKQRSWLSGFPSLIEKLDASDRSIAQALQAAFCVRFKDLQLEAKQLLETVWAAMMTMDSERFLSTYQPVINTFLVLDDDRSAELASRSAVNFARDLGDVKALAAALNFLGVILYSRGSPEYEVVSETLRTVVAKSGTWRFSQASHWLPAEYHARCGDAKRAIEATALFEDVILLDEMQLRRFKQCARLVDILICLISEQYDMVLNKVAHEGILQSAYQPYHFLIAAALAHGFNGDDTIAATYISDAKSAREEIGNRFEIDGPFGVACGEIVALCLLGKWAQAKRLLRVGDGRASIPTVLHRALSLLANGPPFGGVATALEPCVGKPYIGLIALIATRVVDKWVAQRETALLSAAESEILLLISQGKSNKDIAQERSRSAETVKRQAASLFKKLGVENRTSAVAIARERGLL